MAAPVPPVAPVLEPMAPPIVKVEATDAKVEPVARPVPADVEVPPVVGKPAAKTIDDIDLLSELNLGIEELIRIEPKPIAGGQAKVAVAAPMPPAASSPVVTPPVAPAAVVAPPAASSPVVAPPVAPAAVVAPPVAPAAVVAPPVAPATVVAPPAAPSFVVAPPAAPSTIVTSSAAPAPVIADVPVEPKKKKAPVAPPVAPPVSAPEGIDRLEFLFEEAMFAEPGKATPPVPPAVMASEGPSAAPVLGPAVEPTLDTADAPPVLPADEPAPAAPRRQPVDELEEEMARLLAEISGQPKR
jgi:hypothetical protein